MSDQPRLPKTAFAEAAATFAGFCETIAALRHPQTGCPWDLEQTHETLRRYMIEEAYEAVEAVGEGRPEKICDELGDVLLQVVLNAQVAADQGQFTIADVIASIEAKMRRRHPHVFGEGVSLNNANDVRSQWGEIKAAERRAEVAAVPEGAFRAAETKGYPASLQALKIGQIAAKIRFDWDGPEDVFKQVLLEVAELEREVAQKPAASKERLADEIGDVYFSLGQLCRHLELDPEVVSLDANRKFLRRFSLVEKVASERGIVLSDASREVLEELWQEAKKR